MFKINRKVEYALISLRYINHAPKGQLVSAKEICEAYKTPFDPTSRVLQIMAQNGILKAEHGAYGGYQIIKNLSKVTFSQLSEMIVGPIQIANCFHGNYAHCDLASCCNIIGPMLNLNERMSKLFRMITIEELIGAKHQNAQTVKAKSRTNSAITK
ncbi:MAG: Rrf2 family transcriptional regulator [Candidatus Omnitrophota bacterium]